MPESSLRSHSPAILPFPERPRRAPSCDLDPTHSAEVTPLYQLECFVDEWGEMRFVDGAGRFFDLQFEPVRGEQPQLFYREYCPLADQLRSVQFGIESSDALPQFFRQFLWILIEYFDEDFSYALGNEALLNAALRLPFDLKNSAAVRQKVSAALDQVLNRPHFDSTPLVDFVMELFTWVDRVRRTPLEYQTAIAHGRVHFLNTNPLMTSARRPSQDDIRAFRERALRRKGFLDRWMPREADRTLLLDRLTRVVAYLFDHEDVWASDSENVYPLDSDEEVWDFHCWKNDARILTWLSFDFEVTEQDIVDFLYYGRLFPNPEPLARLLLQLVSDPVRGVSRVTSTRLSLV